MSNYLFHWPAWVSFRLIPGVVFLGFVATVIGEIVKARKPAA